MALLLNQAAATALSDPSMRQDKLFPITRAQVLAAIEATKVQTPELHAEEIVLLGPIVSKIPNPQLQVASIAVDRRSGMGEVRLRCPRHECLPFFAMIRASVLLTDWSAELRVATERRSPKPVVLPAAAVKPGQRSLLLLVQPGMRISIPVVFLEAGSPGQMVRVRAIQSSRCYRGVVQRDGSLLETEGIETR